MIEGADRPLALLGAREVRVEDSVAFGAYSLIEVDDRSGPAPRAGQFYMLTSVAGWGAGEGGRPYLPRAISFTRARQSSGGVMLSFLLEDVGPGTHALTDLAPGDPLRLTGPFGNGFKAVTGGALLVAGGIGVAPILALFDELLVTGHGDFAVLAGFRDGAHAAVAELFDGAVVVATDDGSIGHHGLVTELMESRLGRGDATVYACGPPPMLEAVRGACNSKAVEAQLALESGMACGYGACYGCVVPTRNGLLRLCVDGPVIEAADLDDVWIGER